MSRTLMKQARERSHFTAAWATPGDLLRLALRIIRANPPKNLRSPAGAIVHHSGAAGVPHFCFRLSVCCFSNVVFICPASYQGGWVK